MQTNASKIETMYEYFINIVENLKDGPYSIEKIYNPFEDVYARIIDKTYNIHVQNISGNKVKVMFFTKDNITEEMPDFVGNFLISKEYLHYFW